MDVTSPEAGDPSALPRVLAAVKRVWGYDSLRPLQAQAILAGVERRDSLVVMPTGGGKSLCYQVPPLLSNELTVVVSPLIALMKDQVDGLRALGYPAAALHSGLTDAERRDVSSGIRSGKLRLLFTAPERLLSPGFLDYIGSVGVHSFAIDEAHCISQWGHDFRPEYRQLAALKERFPETAIHAYTATATPRVREDIIESLRLSDARVLVGVFDRPNLVYRILPAVDVRRQVVDVLERHRDEASIIYCISRKDTEEMAAHVKSAGFRAAHYHAGMAPERRRQTQEAFSREEIDVVVATVAFGMGIDRSNVRCVIHAAMPKSIEAYQQETGRAGREGLEAECVLLYSAGNAIRWEGIIEKSAAEAQQAPEVTRAQLDLLAAMQRLCGLAVCRHKTLSEYFGQAYEKPSCGACDTCLNEVDVLPDSTVIAQKILSAVARVEGRFGVGHVCDVLTGANTEMIRKYSHDQLSTYGLLKEMSKKEVTALAYQLIDQGVLGRTPGDMPTVHLIAASKDVLRGQRQVALVRPKRVEKASAKGVAINWEGVDKVLFEHLRALRRSIADEQGVPPFVVFSDVTLRELARVRPVDARAFRRIKGVGEKKSADLGTRFIEAIKEYCDNHKLEMNRADEASTHIEYDKPRSLKSNPAREEAFRLFAQGVGIGQVSAAIDRAASTTFSYLTEYIQHHKPASVSPWIASDLYERIAEAARKSDEPGLRPVYDKLAGACSYDDIRVVLAHLQAVHE